jgi:UDP-N-acetyl-D-galactosamine dehydrogenase
MILAGRRINDDMANYVASRIIKLMLRKGQQPANSRVLMMGLAFKENCPDVRNTKVVDIVNELASYGSSVDVFDPWVDPGDARQAYGIELTEDPAKGAYDVVVLAVAHKQFCELGEQGIKAYGKPDAVYFDIKYLLPQGAADGRL